jgi:hypothetical protein
MTPSVARKPPRAAVEAQRDFLYQRRLVSLRPFITDDGVPGLQLRLAGDETIALRIEAPLLELLDRAIGRLRECAGPAGESVSAGAGRRT